MHCPRAPFLFLALFIVSAAAAAQPDLPRREHLGEGVNSTAEELTPVISPDGRTLYFVRDGHKDNIGYPVRKDDQDIWYATLTPSGKWSKAKNIGSPLSNTHYNSLYGISADGNKALVLGHYEDGIYVKRGYSLSIRQKNGWGPPMGMDIDGYEEMDVGQTVNAFLSADAQILLLCFSQNEDDHDADIYISERISDLKWTRPRALSICTTNEEACPFLASDNETLYFSSIRPGGYGRYDVYVARRTGDSWYEWSEPVNCGAAINGARSEMYYTIPASGQYAYFVSIADVRDDLDIYRIELPDSLRPRPVVLVRGRILDAKTGKPVETEVVYELLPGGAKVGAAHANPETGYYEIILPYGKNYGYYARQEGYYPVSENLDLSKLTAYQEIEKNLTLAPIEKGTVIRLNNIFFDFNMHELRPESYPELDRLIVVMNERPAMTIQINGHTDNIGTPQYNMGLSERRAQAVEAYLLGKGIAPQRMKIKPFGLTKPLASNDTEEGRQQNRRVEFLVLGR